VKKRGGCRELSFRRVSRAFARRLLEQRERLVDRVGADAELA
jgi:hypothetical protein